MNHNRHVQSVSDTGIEKMRKNIILAGILIISGIVLVIGSLYTVPYTMREQIRVDREKTWVDEAFVLNPSMDRDFILDSIVQNVSIFQIDVNSEDFITFKIIAVSTDKVWFEREARWDFTSYWTPPLSFGIWRFIFHNPSTGSVNVTAKVTEFYLKITEDRVVTHYRPMLDAVYGYVGVVLVMLSLVLNLVHASRPQKDTLSKSSILAFEQTDQLISVR